MSRLEKKNENQLLLFDLNPPISIPINKKTDWGKEREGLIYIVEDKRREEIKVGFTNCIERRVNKELPRDRVRLTRLARMQVPTIDMELHFHDWLHKMGINSVGSGRSEWYSSKNKGEILGYLYRLPNRYLKKGKLSAEKMAIMQNLIDNNYFDVEFFETPEKRSDVLVAQKTKGIPFLTAKEAKQIAKTAMIRDSSHILKALSPSALKHRLKEDMEHLKEEKLRGMLQLHNI